MSACISRHGEFGEHIYEQGEHWCERCGVYNEEGATAELTAQRDHARALVVALEQENAQTLKLAELLGQYARSVHNIHNAYRHLVMDTDKDRETHDRLIVVADNVFKQFEDRMGSLRSDRP